MSEPIASRRTTLLSSDGFRRFAKQGLGAKIFRSEAYRQLTLAKQYVASYYKTRSEPSRFQDVKTFCMFVGHNKSGTSMIGALLDAHPNIILSDEVDALQYVSAGFRREQIYHILLRGSRREAAKGRVTARRLSGYSFAVPGQWQGRYSTLRVIGDGTVGSSTRRFAQDPGLLGRLRQLLGEVDLKLIQLIRNPYDPISLIMVRGKRSFENAIEHYFANCEAIAGLQKQLDSSSLLPVRYEDFVRQPGPGLSQICSFVGLDADNAYLDACASIIHPTPNTSRHMVAWDRRWINVVRERMERFEFLQGYSFD